MLTKIIALISNEFLSITTSAKCYSKSIVKIKSAPGDNDK